MALAGEGEEKKGGAGEGKAPGVEDRTRSELAAGIGQVNSVVGEGFFEDGGADLHAWEGESPKKAAENEDGDGQSDAGGRRARALIDERSLGHGAVMVVGAGGGGGEAGVARGPGGGKKRPED